MKKKKSNRKSVAKRPIEKVCRNCLLYDGKKGLCRATILMEGQRINLPMYPNDPCFFEEEITVKNEKGEVIDRFTPQVQEVKWWVEDPNTGKKSNKGVVKMEYPPDFFGKEINPDEL